MEDHIVKSYDDDIDQLNSQVAAMGSACEWQLSKALKALELTDIGLAQAVVAEDQNLNALYASLEENSVRLLARRTPLAGDLRYLLSTMRTGSELERIGDYAANIAKRVIELEGFGRALKDPVDLIQEIGKCCRKMITDVVAAFVRQDADTAVGVWHRDDLVDQMFARLMVDLRGRMQRDASMVDCCTRMIFMGRCLERIGDHITNVAEAIYYIETGETYIGNLDNTV